MKDELSKPLLLLWCVVACLLLWWCPFLLVIVFPIQFLIGPAAVLSLKKGDSAVLWWFLLMDLPEAFILFKLPFIWFLWLVYAGLMHFVLDEFGERQ